MSKQKDQILVVHSNFNDLPTLYSVGINDNNADLWLECDGLIINSNENDYTVDQVNLVSKMDLPRYIVGQNIVKIIKVGADW